MRVRVRSKSKVQRAKEAPVFRGEGGSFFYWQMFSMLHIRLDTRRNANGLEIEIIRIGTGPLITIEAVNALHIGAAQLEIEQGGILNNPLLFS